MTTTLEAFDVEGAASAAALGDLDALAALFEHFYNPLLRHLLTRCHNNIYLAEDVASAAWERVAGNIGTYRARGGGFEAWLFTIARRCLAGHYRIAKRRPERLDGEMLAHDQASDAETPDEALARKFEQHHIAAAVNKLPAAQRRCILLRFVAGLSCAEVAVIMGKNTNAIKQLQLRAIRSLRTQVGDFTGRAVEAYDVVDAVVVIGSSGTGLAKEGTV